MACPVIESSHIIGKKWSIPIIEEVAISGFRGFNNFLAKANITPRILSMQLKELENAGIIKRKCNHSSANAKYSLTEKGREMHNIITEIKKWNMKWKNVPDYCLEKPCTECSLYNGNL